MTHSLEQKEILIVPLSLFVQFNTKIAREKFANLSGKFFEDLFSCDEELEDHNQFCENLLQKILTSQIVADFNLGKKTKHEFITELLSFLNLPSNKSSDIEAAWNSLIEFNRESIEAFYALIKLTDQGKSIYFIGNTNELHAEKILKIFSNYSYKKLSFLQNLPNPTQVLPIVISSELANDSFISGKIYFCLSYTYKTLIEQPQDWLTTLFTTFKKTSGLLTHLKKYLNDTGKTKDDILLINAYEKTSIAKKLGLDALSKEEFYTALHAITSNISSQAHSDFLQSDRHHPSRFSVSNLMKP